ncbi:DUF4198 domain-containing protein [soil metagenome]
MRNVPLVLALAALTAAPAQAHFGMIIPESPILDQVDGREIVLSIGFGHPFDPSGLMLERPSAFGVTSPDGEVDLLPELEDAEFHGAAGFRLRHEVARPGVQVFHMEPEPYWEPAEDVFIVHYTKLYVPAFGDDEGWDAELGLPIEIVPLARPFGLWAGNVFQGIVKLGGEPLPGAEIEVEHYNAAGSATSPSTLMTTQTILADEAGVFTYAAPAPGWWGFSALETSDEQKEHEGEAKDIEIGGVLWVHFEPWMAGE